MNVKKRFRDFLVELKAEKASALDDLEKEYQAKRRRIEEEYDLTGLVNSVEPCNLCDKVSAWSCSNCKYNLCRDCLGRIHKSRSELMVKRIRTLKLSSLPLALAKKKFIEDGLKCPQCRTTKLTVK